MKKILCLLLCMIMAMSMLTACAEETIGDDPVDYVPTDIPSITLNFYIIGGEQTVSNTNVKTTVESALSAYTYGKFKTALNVEYISADVYQQKVATDLSGSATVDILLINSKEMFDSLMTQNKLVDLTSYYDTTTFGVLNAKITSTLLDASRVNGKLYTVPNNRVLGTYSYLLIDRAEAKACHFDELTVKTMTTLDNASLLELKQAITDSGKNPDDYIKVVSGMYADKELYYQEGYWCNILANPEVTAEDAFLSAFAISTECQYPDRAMEIIYTLNTDSVFRNLLQYGVLNTNYMLDENGNVDMLDEGNDYYHMDVIYTGDVFEALNCEALGITDEMKGNGKLQNADSVYNAETAE